MFLWYPVLGAAPAHLRLQAVGPPCQRAVFFEHALCFSGKEGGDMVSYSDLFLFATFIVSLISLILQIMNNKKK